MIQEGVIAGIPAIDVEDWTIGEIRAQVLAYHERKRREEKTRAHIATGEAVMIGYQFSNGKAAPDLWEVFPFWTEEEVKEARLEKYRRIMEKYTAAGGGKNV